MPATAPRRKKAKIASDALPLESANLSVSLALFEKFQQLIHQETGIWLGDSKMALLCGRLSRRLRTLKVSTLDEYYEYVIESRHEEERVAMIDAITTNETRFFRDPRHFEFIEQRIIPRWRAEAQEGRQKIVRLWSAGCSSGEEPYSLAMLLARHLPAEQGWNVSIFATDISTRMLAHARNGIYSITKSPDIPQPLLKDYMLRGIDHQDGQMKVMPEIRSMIEFQKLNLRRGPYPPNGHFDLVLCRNVLIYFDFESKQKVIEHLLHSLARNGVLFVGQAENLSSVNSKVRTLAPAVYAQEGELVGF